MLLNWLKRLQKKMTSARRVVRPNARRTVLCLEDLEGRVLMSANPVLALSGGPLYQTAGALSRMPMIRPGVATSFSVSAPSTATAGAFFPVSITARDRNGNIATSYSGTVTFTTSSQAVFVEVPHPHGVASASSPATLTLSNGVGNGYFSLDKAGNVTLTATAAGAGALASIQGASASIAVNAATATSLVVSAPTAVTAGVGFSVTITAKDYFGNPTNYNGPVTITSSDGQTVSPATAKLTNGAANVTVTLQKAGAVALTTKAGYLTGASGRITVQPVFQTYSWSITTTFVYVNSTNGIAVGMGKTETVSGVVNFPNSNQAWADVAKSIAKAQEQALFNQAFSDLMNNTTAVQQGLSGSIYIHDQFELTITKITDPKAPTITWQNAFTFPESQNPGEESYFYSINGQQYAPTA